MDGDAIVSREMVHNWRVNYGLMDRTPMEASKWWDTNLGYAPTGAVAALGVAIDGLDAQRELIATLMDALTAVRADFPDLERWEYGDGESMAPLARKIDAAIAQAKGYASR